MLPGARVTDANATDKRQDRRWRASLTQDGDRFGLAGHEHQTARHADSCLRPGKPGKKYGAGPVGHPILIGIGKAQQLAGGTKKVCALASADQQGAIRKSGHTQWKIEATGKNGDAKVVRIDSGSLHSEGDSTLRSETNQQRE